MQVKIRTYDAIGADEIIVNFDYEEVYTYFANKIEKLRKGDEYLCDAIGFRTYHSSGIQVTRCPSDSLTFCCSGDCIADDHDYDEFIGEIEPIELTTENIAKLKSFFEEE